MKRTLTALILAATTALAAPASAGGTITFGFTAQNADEANAIRTGLTLYQVFNDVHANGHISQNGLNNLAALGQSGHGHVGIIHQEGNNHEGSISQSGSNNSCGLFQFGNGASGHVNQSGHGEACLIFQAGF